MSDQREIWLKNLRAMKSPSPLLKFGHSGKPKFRFFRLSNDLKVLHWESKNKTADQTQVEIGKIKSIKYGQRTEKFLRNNRKDLEHLSFSVFFSSAFASGATGSTGAVKQDTLDLVCRDEKEFQLWAHTLVAMHEGHIEQSIMEEAAQMPPLVAQRSLNSLEPTHSRQMSSRADLNDHRVEETNDVYMFGWGEWGQTAFGADVPLTPAPKLVESLLGKGVTQVASGWSHTAVLLESGAVWQSGNRLATGLENDMYIPQPTTITEQHGVISVVCGAFHTLALTVKGQVFSWGCNFHGQLGHGHNTDVKQPTLIEHFKNTANTTITKLSAGGQSSMALSDQGDVYTWGCGKHGNLGHNDEKDRDIPTIVDDLKGAGTVKIAAGGDFMFACAERESYAWGGNTSGQLGLGHENQQLRPHVNSALRGNRVLDISCGTAHAVAIVYISKLDKPVLYSWGSNVAGQTGHGNKSVVSKPSSVMSMANDDITIVEVACGDLHTCVRTANGNVYSCGNNNFGQLGLGNSMSVSEFSLIPLFKDKEARAVVCGGEHTAVLTARAWISDSEAKECMNCKAAFTFVNRKHQYVGMGQRERGREGERERGRVGLAM
jgi:alpha-tubulin suppressor-like RCC1 family protein